MVNKLKALLAIICLVMNVGAWPASSRKFPNDNYVGPCNLVACAEAYSVTRGMTIGYAGPLFQINNGSSNLDIGQVNHVVDMTTWSAFCSGVASNCTYTKFYAQIHTTSNDLTPFNAANKTPFTIEAATGLPQINNPTGYPYVIGGSSDNASTGITAGGAAESVIEVGQSQVTDATGNAFCCGNFGTAHLWNAGNTQGTDFLFYVEVGQSLFAQCRTTVTLCMGLEEESVNDQEDYSGVSMDYIGVVTWDGTTNVRGFVNGLQLFNHPPVVGAGSMNSGKRIHLAGGGDLTPTPLIAREMLITNTAISPTQVANITANVTAFYPGITFKSGPTNAPSPYVGPGDIVSSALTWVGLRAYTVAIATAGTQAVINVQNPDNSHTCDILVAANGGLGNTANCSTGGDNGQSVSSFCLAVSQGSACAVLKVYDQSGSGLVYLSSGVGNAKLELFCINFTPCLVNEGNSIKYSVANSLGTFNQPYSNSAVALRYSAFTSHSGVMSAYNGGNGPFLDFALTANTVGIFTSTGGTFPEIDAAATDYLFHAVQSVFDTTSSISVDGGAASTGSAGTDAIGPGGTFIFGRDNFNGCDCFYSEGGFWPSAFTSPQQTNMNANQHNYWGF